MKYAIGVSSMLFIALVVLPATVFAAEEISPGLLVTSPNRYEGRSVAISVEFEGIDNTFRAWEEEENLKQSRKIKFKVKPLGKINCFANRTLENEKILGSLQAGDKISLVGYLKEGKKEAKVKVKGEFRDRKETIKTGQSFYYFVVQKMKKAGEGLE
jgi:hypothetical protein